MTRRKTHTVLIGFLLVVSFMTIAMVGAAGATPADDLDLAAGEEVVPEEFGEDDEDEELPLELDGDVTVTLVTGEEVTVRQTSGQLQYEISAAEGDYETVEEERGFYLLPEGVSEEDYDLELFNVTRLVAGGYYDSATGETPVVVELTDDRGVSAEHSIEGLSLHTDYSIIDAAAGTISGELVAASDGLTPETLDAAGIERVHLDHQYETLLDESAEEIRAETARSDFGVDGSGISVAVLDTGIDADHPDFGDRVVYEESFVPDDDTTADEQGHGTHVAGTVAGDGTEDDDFVGVAPGADLMNMRTCDADGGCFLSGLIDAIDESVDEGADIISMSLGGPGAPDEPLSQAANNAVDEGAVVITSAGNSGPGFESLTSPGNADNAIAVAADDTLDRNWDEDVAQFSSRGPTEEFQIKPEITAPGVLIEATGSQDAGEFPYTTKSGTSMSAPHISGVVALMLDADEDLTPEEIRSNMMTTADRLETAATFNENVDADVYSSGPGQVNTTAAFEPSIFVDDPRIGFDFDPFEDLGEVKSDSLTVENAEDETLDLDVEAELEHIEGDSEGVFEVNRTSLELDPGESAGIEITVNASADRSGLYSGYLTLVDEDESHTAAVFGYSQPIDPEDAIAVDKQALDGRSVEGESVRVQDIGGEQQETVDLDEDGIALFEPEADGPYTVWSTGRLAEFDEDPIIVADIIEDPDETDGITLDEGDAIEYEFDLEELENERGELLDRQLSAGIYVYYESGLFGETYRRTGVTSLGVGITRSGTAFFAGPTADEMVEDEQIIFGLNRMPVPEETHRDLETGGIQNDRVYDLFTWSDGLVEDEEDAVETVTEDDLRALDSTYLRDDPDEIFQNPDDEANAIFSATHVFEADEEFGIGRPTVSTFTNELGAQVDQTLYHMSEGMVSEWGYAVDYSDTQYDGMEYDLTANRTTDVPPETVPAEFNAHPSAPGVDDEFGTIVNPSNIYQEGPFYADPVTDIEPFQPYETDSFATDNTYRVIHEGEVIEEEDEAGDYTIFIQDDDMPDLENGDLVEIELEAEALAPLQHHETRYATEYHEDDENDVPEFAAIEVDADAFNSGTAGPLEIEVDVTDYITGEPDEFDAYSAAGDVEDTPFEDDSDWSEADVEHHGDGVYTVSVDITDDEPSLSLAFKAVDEEGSLAETTFYDVGTWETIEDGFFDVDISGTSGPVEEGDTLEVDAEIRNTGTETVTQTVTLDAGDLGSADEQVELESGESATETFELDTNDGSAGSYTATVSSDDTDDSTLTAVSETLPEFDIGDVNEDGDIDMADVILSEEFVAGLDPEPFNDNLGDVTRDGEVGLADVVLLAEHVAGLGEEGSLNVSDVDARSNPEADEVTVTATVTNDGDLGVVEHVDIRLAPFGSSLEADTTGAVAVADVGPGATETIEVTLDASHLRAGVYDIGVFVDGNSDEDTVGTGTSPP